MKFTPSSFRFTPRSLGEPARLAFAIATLLLAATPLTPFAAAQNPNPLMGQSIQEVTFPGADELSEEYLREAVVTRRSRCRGLLLTPFCWLTDWDVLVDRQHLNPDELPRDELRVMVVYFREGFREAAAAADVTDRDDGVEVAFHVEEGPPTLVEEFEVRQVDEALSDRQLGRMGLPREGQALSLNRLEEAFERIQEELGGLGFIDAEIRDTIHVSGRAARVEVVIDPGRRATVREFEIVGNEDIQDETIVRALHLEEGEVLTMPLVRRSRRALHQSNLFHEADVMVPEQPDSAKVVRVRVREAPPRMGRVGGAINTLEFAQLEGRFTHYNWLGGGRRVDLRATVGNLLAPQFTGRLFFYDILPGELAGVDPAPFERPTWQLSAEFSQPAFRAAENTLTTSLFAHRRVIPAVSVDYGIGGELSLTRLLAHRMPLSTTYRYELTSVRAGDVYFCVTVGICDPGQIQSLRRRSALSPLAMSFHADRSDDALAPTTGYRARVDLEHASRYTLSDFRHNRLSGEASYYQPFGGEPRHVIAATLRGGWVRAMRSTPEATPPGEPGLTILHPRKRFFAGGARSVRGYPENQLGPLLLTIPREELLEVCSPQEIDDGTCDPADAPTDRFAPRALGGTSLLEGSVEYRFPVAGVTGAVFVDAALVGGRLDAFLQDAAGAVTPGFGIRFASPAGPIRIDLGFRPRDPMTLPVVTETDPEPTNDIVESELIQLDQRLRWDRLEDEGTIGRILGRLTLHFSLGEAF